MRMRIILGWKMYNNLRSNKLMGVLIFFLCLFFISSLAAQNQSPAELKKQMAKIRQSTNWDDPVASKKANEEIKKLAKQLMLSGQNNNAPKDDQTKEQQEEGAEYKMKLWNQIWESAKQGEGGDILLGKPIREEIIEEFKEDESPKNINPDFLKEMTFLVIDMSIPTVQHTIDVMEYYKSIKTLIITSGKYPVAVNLQDILNKASKYPLENLYIINFGQFVTKIPDQVTHFPKLSTLGVFNNKISQLPKNINFLKGLDSLFIEINPISTLFPAISSIKNLKKLGIAKTSISDAEIKKIQTLLPNCEVIIK